MRVLGAREKKVLLEEFGASGEVVLSIIRDFEKAQGRVAVVAAFVVMAAMGAPFKWKKQRGGLVTELVGLCTDYSTSGVVHPEVDRSQAGGRGTDGDGPGPA